MHGQLEAHLPRTAVANRGTNKCSSYFCDFFTTAGGGGAFLRVSVARFRPGAPREEARARGEVSKPRAFSRRPAISVPKIAARPGKTAAEMRIAPSLPELCTGWKARSAKPIREKRFTKQLAPACDGGWGEVER
ncbi:hypothetical protein MRX96_058271 [Rhipicephalus microplus]